MDYKDDAAGSLAIKQESVACKVLMFIIISFVGTTAAFSFVAYLIAVNIDHREHPLAPPSNLLLDLFYFAALIALLGSVLWTRFRSEVSSLPYRDFQQRTMFGLALANVSEYLGLVWVILGGAFGLSVPLFAGSALVTLVFILPSALRRKSALRQRSSFDSGQRK